MMNSDAKKSRSRSETAEECRNLYDEVCDLQNHFKWTLNELCTKVFVVSNDDLNSDEEAAGIRKLQQNTKKMFQRKSWEQGKATVKTLAELEKLRSGIFLTDDYKNSQLCGSSLSPELRKEIARAAKEMNRELKLKDYE